MSQHLRTLREAGLVRREKAGRRRIYRIEPGRLREVYDWVAHYARFWRRKLESLAVEQWLMPNDFEPHVGHDFTLRAEPAPGFDGIVRCRVLAIDDGSRSLYRERLPAVLARMREDGTLAGEAAPEEACGPKGLWSLLAAVFRPVLGKKGDGR